MCMCIFLGVGVGVGVGVLHFRKLLTETTETKRMMGDVLSGTEMNSRTDWIITETCSATVIE